MIVYNRLYAGSGRRVQTLEELPFLVSKLCAEIGDPIRDIRKFKHGVSRRFSREYPTYEFEAIHEKKLIDGRLFREHVVFEVISDEG
ncbi:hypothetical protein [Levilactobacillus wangkuiensis]|uniref:hypothetical protein n=1 Tax=Levilactobacillus wangkuiensis TaxID=2799566 RepID=UPI00194578AB|nr:hypothetical protein [Levilactobacillus wangkuiensis]